MRRLLLLVALGAAAQGAAAQDTTVVVHGLVGQPPGSATWVIGLPGPFRYRDRVIAELALTGDSAKWTSHAGHFVEARGTLDAGAPAPAPARVTLRVRAMREVDPEGTVRKMVSNSFTHRVAVTLWVLPRTFAWVDSAGRATGVGPVIVYTANNHGESDVTMEFASKDFVCFSVESPDGGAPWRFARQLNTPTDQLRVTLPKFVREVARVPRDAARQPGRYTVRAGFCGFTEYELETEIEVTR